MLVSVPVRTLMKKASVFLLCNFFLCLYWLFVAAGIVLFLLVEKIVRYVDEMSGGVNAWNHGHHRHHNKNSKKLKGDDDDVDDNLQVKPSNEKDESISSEGELLKAASDERVIVEKPIDTAVLRKVI